MSFDIFMMPFQNGVPLHFQRSLLLEIFGYEAGLEESEFSQIEFVDGGGAQLFGADDEIIADGLSFNHFGGVLFLEGLWKLAERTNAVIFWPGEPGNALVTSPEALEHADPEFIEPLQPVKIIGSSMEFGEYMAERFS